MGKVIQLSDMGVMPNTDGFVLVDNIYIRDYFNMPLLSSGKVEHGKNILDIALMFQYWEKTDSVKTNMSRLADLIGMDRRTVEKYINSDLEAYGQGKRCQVQEMEKEGRTIKLRISHKPVKKYFTPIPMEIISSKELTPLEKKVYILLLFYSNNDDGIAWVSRSNISKACGSDQSDSKITKAIQALESAGLLSYITIQKPNGQKKNFYKPLLVVEKGKGIVRLSEDIYVSPSNVNSAVGVYMAIGEKALNTTVVAKEEHIEDNEISPEEF